MTRLRPPPHSRLRRHFPLVVALACLGLLVPGGALRAETSPTHTLRAEGLEFTFTAPDAALAERLWPLMQADLAAVRSRLRLFPADTLRVVLAPTLADFRAAIPGSAPGNAVGLYVPGERTVYLRAPRTEAGGRWDLRGVLRHELAHGVLDRAIGEPMPLWLHEGLALLLADELDFLDEAGLATRAMAGGLIPLPRLLRRFPTEPERQEQAYAQAASFVRFLLAREGMGGLTALLRGLARGDDPWQVFAAVYGADLTELEAAWHKELASRFSWWSLVTTTTVLGGLGAPLLVLAWLRRTLEQRRRLRQMAAEESPTAEEAADGVTARTGGPPGAESGPEGAPNGTRNPAADPPSPPRGDSPPHPVPGTRSGVDRPAHGKPRPFPRRWRPPRTPRRPPGTP